MHWVKRMDGNWSEIIKKALQLGLESSKGAVPGAKLRQIISRIAHDFSEQYPPAGFDVTHVEGHEFVLIDANGRENLVKRASYLNLDPHGYVRNSAS
jgi:hypothetical protein